MARFLSRKEDFENHFKKMMYDTSFDMCSNVDLLLESSVFDYTKHFVNFFEYMAKNCSDENTLYTKPDFLRNKINDFGEQFKSNYIDSFSNTHKKSLKLWDENKILEKANELKKKYCGNLLEIINGLYSIDFEIIKGFEFDTWCNNGKDDFMGVDGILVSSINQNIKISMNTKHSNFEEIGKFSPFQKLGNWSLMYTRELDDENKLKMINLPVYGVIFTDNDTKDWTSSNFPGIYIVNDVELCKNLGKYGKNYGKVNIWKHWYNIIKECI